MPAIKVVDRDPRGPKRKSQLWQCFGSVGVNPHHIKEGKGTYYAIVPQEKVELIISQESKQTFQQKGFEIHTPLEYNAMRTVIVKNVDQVIADYEDQEVIDSIETANQGVKVESIFRLAQSGKIL